MSGPRLVLLWKKLYSFVIGATILTRSSANHLRGGTISWRPIGGNEVDFFFTMAWQYDKGPGCTEGKIGQFVDNLKNGNHWKCVQGCGGTPVDMATAGYNCMAASKLEDWEQGQRTFNYTFSSTGPFNVSYRDAMWMQTQGMKGGGNSSIETIVDLSVRSDTNRPNSSPVALSQAIYHMQYGCQHELRIPVLDPDGDNVRCRWATGEECGSICDGLDPADLNETSCTITFNASGNGYNSTSYYAVALTIEDFPPNTIQLDGVKTKTSADSLSSVPMQFTIKTPSYKPGISCDMKPRFVSPTPSEGSIVLAQAGDTITEEMVAYDNSTQIEALTLLGPSELQTSNLTAYKNTPNTSYRTFNWTTSTQDIGKHIVCSYATNTDGIQSDSRCFTIKIVGNCQPNPCANGGVCHDGLTNFTCLCVNGWQGATCDHSSTTLPSTTFPQLRKTTSGSCAVLAGLGYMNTVSCETEEYCNCSCVISPHDLPTKEDNLLRYLLAGITGFSTGLVLSLLNFCCWSRCGLCLPAGSSHSFSTRDNHPPTSRMQKPVAPVDTSLTEQKAQGTRPLPARRPNTALAWFNKPLHDEAPKRYPNIYSI